MLISRTFCYSVVIVVFSLTLLNLPLSGQSYFEMFVVPKLFQNAYEQTDKNSGISASCTINDSTRRSIEIKYDDNGSIHLKSTVKVSDFHSKERTSERVLVFDDCKRIIEWINVSPFGSIYRFCFSYPDENTVLIEYRKGEIKKSESKLIFSKNNRLLKFQQTQIISKDSLEDISFEISSKKNEMYIKKDESVEKYFFDEYGKLTTWYTNDELVFSASYNDAGRILSKIYYYYLPLHDEDVILTEYLFFYSKNGQLLQSEERHYSRGDVVSLHLCKFDISDSHVNPGE